MSPSTLPANSLMERLAHIWVIMNIGCTIVDGLENQAQRMDRNPGELALGNGLGNSLLRPPLLASLALDTFGLCLWISDAPPSFVNNFSNYPASLYHSPGIQCSTGRHSIL